MQQFFQKIKKSFVKDKNAIDKDSIMWYYLGVLKDTIKRKEKQDGQAFT